MNMALLIAVAYCTLLSFASRSDAQGNAGNRPQTSTTVAHENKENGMMGTSIGGCTGTNCIEDGNSKSSPEQNTSRSTTSSRNTTSKEISTALLWTNATTNSNVAAASTMSESTSSNGNTTTTPKGTTAHAQVAASTLSGMETSSVTLATGNTTGNTTGPSNGGTGTSAASAVSAWRCAHLEVLIAALGALLWRSSL